MRESNLHITKRVVKKKIVMVGERVFGEWEDDEGFKMIKKDVVMEVEQHQEADGWSWCPRLVVPSTLPKRVFTLHLYIFKLY